MNEEQYISQMLNRTMLYIDKECAKKVRNTVVAISGLGGVGAITVELLARWGIKRFRLLDMDRYEPSNLNRQLFATSQTLGQYKVDVSADRIKQINPFAKIEMAIRERVTNENVHKFIKGADIIIQNADNPSCKLFYLSAREHKVPLVNGYASITGGRVQTFDYRKSPCQSELELWWNRFKFGDTKPLCAMNPKEIAEFDSKHVHSTAPSINFVVNLVGCFITAEAIKLITGEGTVIHYPKYVEIDVFNYKMKIRNSNSPFNPENIKRLFSVIKNSRK